MSRFVMTWTSAMLLMSAAIKDMYERIDPVAQPGEQAHQLMVYPGQTRGIAYEIQISDCVDLPLREILHPSQLPLEIGVDSDRPCRVDARRQDGDLWTPWNTVSGQGVVALGLPVVRTGGLGVTFVPRQHGAMVRDVHRGLAGKDMGLEYGDVITAVNGESLAGLSDDEMVGVITGPEGSHIELDIINVRTGGTLRRGTYREYVHVSSSAVNLIPVIRW